jgi:hypothetical protein
MMPLFIVRCCSARWAARPADIALLIGLDLDAVTTLLYGCDDIRGTYETSEPG